METNPKTKSKTDAPDQLREMAEKGATQSRKAFEKMSAVGNADASHPHRARQTGLKRSHFSPVNFTMSTGYS